MTTRGRIVRTCVSVSAMLMELRPGGEAQAGAGAGRRAIAGHIFEPVEVEVLDGAGERHPVENLRAAGMQLVARQVLQEASILIGAGLENGAVKILVDEKMAQSTGSRDADADLAGKTLDRLADGMAERVAAA